MCVTAKNHNIQCSIALREFGEKLYNLRVARRVTLARFADALGMDPSDVSALEMGEKNPTESNISDMTALLGLTESEASDLRSLLTSATQTTGASMSRRLPANALGLGKEAQELSILLARRAESISDNALERIREILEDDCEINK